MPSIQDTRKDLFLQDAPKVVIKPSDVVLKGFSEKEQDQCQAVSDFLKDYIYKQLKLITRDRKLINRRINVEKRQSNDNLLKQARKSIPNSPKKVNCTNSLLNEFELLSNGSIEHHEANPESIIVNLQDFELFEATQNVISISDDEPTNVINEAVPHQPSPDVNVRPSISILHDHSYFNFQSCAEENEEETNEERQNEEEPNEDLDSDGSASDCSGCSKCAEGNDQVSEVLVVKPIILKPGKQYRRSLNLIRKTMALVQINEVEEHDEGN